MRFSSSQKFFAVLALTLGVALAFGWIFLSLSSVVEGADGVLGDLEENLLTLEEERASARHLKRVLEEKEEDLAQIRAFFIDRKQPVEFIEYLEGVARATGNTIALDVTESGPGEPLLFRLTIEGKERDATRYVSLLGSMPYEIRIQDLSFQRLDPTVAGSLSPRGARAPEARLLLTLYVGTKPGN